MSGLHENEHDCIACGATLTRTNDDVCARCHDDQAARWADATIQGRIEADIDNAIQDRAEARR